jgi:hypothetical protein
MGQGRNRRMIVAINIKIAVVERKTPTSLATIGMDTEYMALCAGGCDSWNKGYCI